MSGHAAAGPVEAGSQAVLERIQVSVMPGTTKQPVNVVFSTSVVPEKGAETTIKETKRNDEISNSQRVWTSLLAGAAAGALAKTTIAPLDRTKINFQISQQPYSARAAVEFLVQSYTKDGLMSLWRGNSASMVRIVPYAAIQFTAHEQWKRILKVNGAETNKATRFLAGSLAGVTSQSLTYPLDLARARMAVTQKAEYKTLRAVFVRIYRQEGISTFYRGFTATILGVIPYAGFSFFTYDTLKHLLASSWYGHLQVPISIGHIRVSITPLGVALVTVVGISFLTAIGPDAEAFMFILRFLLTKKKPIFTEQAHTINSPGLSAMSALICGALAGVVGQTSSYPLDIVRRRMQTSAIKGAYYHTIYGTTVKIYTEEGVMAFFKGLSMNWVKGPVAVGISFATYDIILVTLRKIMC